MSSKKTSRSGPNAKKPLCNVYDTFGVCKYGANECKDSHDCWPNHTHTVKATITPDNASTFGLVTFAITERIGVKTETYYISNDTWFIKGAVNGDEVELQVSEKVNKMCGSHFARVVRVLGSNSDFSGARSNVRTSEHHPCSTFSTFNDCKYGDTCRNSHSQEADQVFELGKIVSVTPCERGNKVVLKFRRSAEFLEETYWVLKDRWYMQDAKDEDLVIFQKSSKSYDGPITYGKVLAILQNSGANIIGDIPLEKHFKRAFTIDQDGTKVRTGAFSVEPCNDHGNSCKLIGIHVLALALMANYNDKLESGFVPTYRQGSPIKPFRRNAIQLAYSMYIHSASDDVRGPLITPVFVDKDSLFNYGKLHNIQKELDCLWLQFGEKSFIKETTQNWFSNLIVDYPDTWKERFVVHQTKAFFNKQITKYLRLQGGCYVIAQSHSDVEISEAEMVIPAKYLNDVEKAWKSDEDEKMVKMAALFGSVNQADNVFLDENYFPDMYLGEALLGGEIPENKIVKVTAPNTRTIDLMNQQIVLNCMLERSNSLYSKEEIYGILAKRYVTPNIFRAVVRVLHNTSATLQIFGIREHWRRSYREVKLKHLVRQALDVPASCTLAKANTEDHRPVETKYDSDWFYLTEWMTVSLAGVHSPEYCNTKLVRVSGKRISKLRSDVAEMRDESVKHMLDNVIASKLEECAPYESYEKGTKITLRRGVELQLQISETTEDADKFHHNLRLLMIGENCHLCLVHLNSPERAFMSNRSDIRQLISSGVTTKMRKDIEDYTLKTSTLTKIAIEWENDYFYGGTFETTEKISERSLLCIRKEIYDDKGEMSFVWTCHAVVCESSEKSVKFLVCSLHQDKADEILGNDNRSYDHVVEIITV